MSAIDTPKNQCDDALIIGAGLAGLMAARRLAESGLSVRVIEARDRVGGRVRSERQSTGHVIDLGAQFVGEDHTLLISLAEEAALRMTPISTAGNMTYMIDENSEPKRSNPEKLPLSLIHQLDLLQCDWRLERAIARLTRGNVASLDMIDAETFIRGYAFSETAIKAIGGNIEGELCAPLTHLSAYEVLDQGRSVGGLAGERASAKWFFTGGAQALAEFLASGLQQSIVLNAPVTEIEPTSSGITVRTKTDEFRGRHAIVTAPPQLYTTIGLMPHLPPSWQKAIEGWRTGWVVKTILVFDEPWWRRTNHSGTVISPRQTFGAIVDGSPEDSSVGILILFSTATGGQTLSKSSIEASRVEQAMQWVRRIHGADVPNPICARSIDWSADPFSLGGYAGRRGIGGWSCAPDLFAPHGRLHFAGTETATKWRSFMEGALQSGVRAADEVLATRG